MANALGTLFSDIANAIRGKTGDTGTMKPAEFPAAITGISVGSGGGESSDLVKYVTFMNGDTVLYRMPVLIGDECKDPQVRGDILTPTKESTPQYSYTYYGWGASDGGSADSNILKNITEDKTVYAIYSSATRYYTITFYDADGTTVLKTTSVAYGRTPSYTPAKEGFDFLEWTPAITTVTGEASYTAVWEERTVFAYGQEITNTWDEIFYYTERGLHTVKYLPGSYKYIEFDDGGRARFDVAATDTDDKADGTGKAPISWIINNAPVAMSVYNDSTAVLISPSINAIYQSSTNVWTETDNADGKWTISMPSGGTLNVKVVLSSPVSSSTLYYSSAIVKINGTEKFNKYAGNYTNDFTVTCEAGGKIEVEASFKKGLLASGTNKIQITFSSESEFVYDYYLKDKAAVYQKGTGTDGSWQYSKLRENVSRHLSSIPENIRNRIVEVYKVSSTRDGGVAGSVTTIDNIWVPSNAEAGNYSPSANVYKGLYPDNNSRAKGYEWMLRDVSSQDYVDIIDASGSRYLAYGVTTMRRYLWGFCTG